MRGLLLATAAAIGLADAADAATFEPSYVSVRGTAYATGDYRLPVGEISVTFLPGSEAMLIEGQAVALDVSGGLTDGLYGPDGDGRNLWVTVFSISGKAADYPWSRVDIVGEDYHYEDDPISDLDYLTFRGLFEIELGNSFKDYWSFIGTAPFTVWNTTPIPLPAAAPMLLTGAALLLGVTRRAASRGRRDPQASRNHLGA